MPKTDRDLIRRQMRVRRRQSGADRDVGVGRRPSGWRGSPIPLVARRPFRGHRAAIFDKLLGLCLWPPDSGLGVTCGCGCGMAWWRQQKGAFGCQAWQTRGLTPFVIVAVARWPFVDRSRHAIPPIEIRLIRDGCPASCATDTRLRAGGACGRWRAAAPTDAPDALQLRAGHAQADGSSSPPAAGAAADALRSSRGRSSSPQAPSDRGR